MQLEKYLNPERTKINPNVRKLLAKQVNSFSEYAQMLIARPVDIRTCKTLDFVEVFFVHLNPSVKCECLTCGKKTRFSGLNVGYNKFCNSSCQMKHESQIAIRKDDAIKRFGVNNYLVKGIERSKSTRSSEVSRSKLSASLRDAWSKNRDDILQKSNNTKLANGKKFWVSYNQKTLNQLRELDFTVVESFDSGKPKIIRHSCGTEQPYGRWSGDTYLCTACSPNPRIKKEESVFSELGDILKIQFERNVKVGNIKVDGLYENVAIDFNGMFWHSQAAEAAGFGKYDHNYHANRHALCADKGIKLIQILETDWLHKKDIVVSRIKHAFDRSPRVYARKCQVKTITYSDAKQFLMTHHLNGSVPASFNFGIFLNDDLLAVATFGKTRFGNRDTYELLRFASKSAVVGGIGKVIKHASQLIKSDILTYSDNFWGNGSSYKSAGFEFVKSVPPGYVYFDKKNFSIVSRHSMRKDVFEKVFSLAWDPTISEQENAKRVNCYRMADAGKNKWVFKYRE